MSDLRTMADTLAYIQILDTLNRYTDAVNRCDQAALRGLFCEDGVWDMGGPNAGPMALRLEGAEAAAIGITTSLARAQLCVQANHAPVIRIDGRRAWARSTIEETVIPEQGGGLRILGAYHDDLVQGDDGIWRFSEKRFRISYIDQSPLTGQVLPVQHP